MNNLTPEQLQQAGLEAVPWETLEDVDLNAWYRWADGDKGRYWGRIKYVDPLRCCVEIFGERYNPTGVTTYFEHSTDGGKTWQPCHNIRPIGGRIEHEKLAVGGEVINKEWEGK